MLFKAKNSCHANDHCLWQNLEHIFIPLALVIDRGLITKTTLLSSFLMTLVMTIILVWTTWVHKFYVIPNQFFSDINTKTWKQRPKNEDPNIRPPIEYIWKCEVRPNSPFSFTLCIEPFISFVSNNGQTGWPFRCSTILMIKYLFWTQHFRGKSRF